MCTRRRRGARFQPNLWVNLDMRKPRRHLSQMRVEPVIFAFVSPGGGDLAGGIAEHRAELMLYPNGIAEFFFDCTDASLRDVCPDAQDIREIGNLDRAHFTFSKRKLKGEHHNAPQPHFNRSLTEVKQVLSAMDVR